ncbi:MAG: class I SAM-dependent methyltransferase, partial [Acetobacteraceae bacterium]
MPDGAIPPSLRIPPIFFGLDSQPELTRLLNQLVQMIGNSGDPTSQWFIADNLITYGHTAGFRRNPRFAAAVTAAHPQPLELAIVWRTHTLCWAAQHCLALDGDFVECGTYEGYSMEVVLRYLDGLPGRHCWLYDLFDPTGAAGEGKRLPAHSPDLFDRVRQRFAPWPNVTVTRGKVPDALSASTPAHIAFLHIDMNNAEAERGALERLFDRVAPGGMVVFDD